MISSLPVTVELAPRDDVVNVQRFPCLFGGNTATLAGELVAFARGSSLTLPVWTTAVIMSTEPRRAIFPAHVSRFALPIQAAVLVTEYIATNPGGQAVNTGAAIVAQILDPLFVLMVIGSCARELRPVLRYTFGRAVKVCESFCPAVRSDDRFATVGAANSDAAATHIVSAGNRAAFLMRVIAWREERLPASGARLFLALGAGLVGASDRAESYLSVGSFFNWFPALLTSFHALNYSIG